VAGKGRGSFRWLSPIERERVAARIRAGDRIAEIVAAFGSSQTTVRRIADELAVAGRRVGHSELRLSFVERERISRGIAAGESGRAIARALGRAPSTVCREIRAGGGRERYRALTAERRAQRCARRPKQSKLSSSARLLWLVEQGLERRWSPEQISARLRIDHPEDPELRISHETIYRSLYVQARGELRRELAASLRTGRTKRRTRGRRDDRGRIPEMIPIAQRPPEVDDRRVPGHWEGDLLMGAGGKSAIATLVERQTRYVLLARLGTDRTTGHVIEALKQRIGDLPAHLIRSLTWDQGRELAAHQAFTVDTGVQIYFCDPRSPWQRATNENTNGLLRQYLPKGSDLAACSQVALDQIAAELNGRPRKTLTWKTPAETMTQLLR
jgi:IS30 family transposase